MSDDTDDNGAKPWTIKGIPPEVRNQSIAAAKRAGMGIGSWTNRALHNAIVSEAKASRDIVPSAPPPVPAVPDVPDNYQLTRKELDAAPAPAREPSVADAAAALGSLLDAADRLATLRVAGVRSHALASLGRALRHQAQRLEGVDLADQAPKAPPHKRVKG